MKHSLDKLIIGIGFGISRFAFSYVFLNYKEDILTTEEIKNSIEIILDSNLNIIAFG